VVEVFLVGYFWPEILAFFPKKTSFGRFFQLFVVFGCQDGSQFGEIARGHNVATFQQGKWEAQAKFYYRPKVCGFSTLIALRASNTLSCILSLFRQYFSH